MAGFAFAIVWMHLLPESRHTRASGLHSGALRLVAALYFGLGVYAVTDMDWPLKFFQDGGSFNLFSAMSLALAVATGLYLQVLHRAATYAYDVANRLEDETKKFDERFKEQESVNQIIQSQLQSSMTLSRKFLQPLIRDAVRRYVKGKQNPQPWHDLDRLLRTQDRLLMLAQPESLCPPSQMLELAKSISDPHDAPGLIRPENQSDFQSLVALVALQIERRYADTMPNDVATTLEALQGYVRSGHWEINTAPQCKIS